MKDVVYYSENEQGRMPWTEKNQKVFDKAPNEEEKKQDPLIQEMANDMVEWECKSVMTPDEAAKDPELRQIVYGALLRCPYFVNETICL